jgi:hypothetical protein
VQIVFELVDENKKSMPASTIDNYMRTSFSYAFFSLLQNSTASKPSYLDTTRHFGSFWSSGSSASRLLTSRMNLLIRFGSSLVSTFVAEDVCLSTI